jgi:hypothetical protein
VKTRILALFAVAAVGWLAVSAASPSAEVQDAKPFGLEGPSTGKYSAVTNCSSSNCHGNGSKGNEYATWAGDDPHRKAHVVLYNDVSTRIQKNLKRDTPAYLDAQCLKCHAVNEEKHYHGEVLPGRALSEGVSCDACHGASQAWLGEHYRDDWKRLTDKEKFDRYGFKQTKDLVARALMCAQCHVGARDREVNHDLIAAGHPRLAFEAARFHFTNNYPKHWKEKLPTREFEMDIWVIGQLASLRQAVDLLAARAERAAEKHAPWPELSEYSCFACHQDITGSKKRSEFGERNGRMPGRAGWQVWYTSQQSNVFGSLQILEFLQKPMGNDIVDPTEVASIANRVVSFLDSTLKTFQEHFKERLPVNSSVDEKRAFAASIARQSLNQDHSKLRDIDWDYLAQLTLALAATAHAAGDTAKDWRPLVAKLQQALAFPPDEGGKRFDCPKDYDAEAVLKLFQELDRKLNRPGGE